MPDVSERTAETGIGSGEFLALTMFVILNEVKELHKPGYFRCFKKDHSLFSGHCTRTWVL